jgi:predicted membrane protein (TIGR00267 family)
VSDQDEENKKTTGESEGPFAGMGRLERVMRALEITHGVEIARRYLAMNAFDGALTMLGLILGGLITINPLNPIPGFTAILVAAAGTTFAMAVSGFSGSYLAESAERDREVEEMGKAMLSDMSETMYAAASRTTSVVVAVVDGLSPAMAAIIIMIPLWFVPSGILAYNVAFYMAMVICFALLFVLGLFLGTISRKNMYVYGAKTLLAGIATAALMLLISILTGGNI